MSIKFAASSGITIGAAQMDLITLAKINAPYYVKLLRWWIMCTDPTYPPGEMVNLEVIHFKGVTLGSAGQAAQVSMQQDNSLGLTPYSTIHAADTVLSTGTSSEVIWFGGMQVWQGLDVIGSGEPTLQSQTGYGPGLDAFVFRLKAIMSTPVFCNFGLLWEEGY